MTHDFLYNIDSRVIIIGLCVVLISCVEIGFRLGKLKGTNTEDSSTSSSVIQGGALTLLALLLAFEVSMAEIRFEARKQILIEEGNAIGTSFLRADLLPPHQQAKLKALLRDYLNTRIDFYRAGYHAPTLQSIEAKTQSLQDTIWSMSAQIARADPHSIPAGLLTQALNDTIDAEGKQSFAYQNHVPESIFDLLICASALVLGLIGYFHGVASNRRFVYTTFLSLMIIVTLFVTLDLDRPRRGLVRVRPDNLIHFREQLDAASKK